MAARDELADLAAELAHRLQQPRIGWARLAREELGDAHGACGAAQREAERGLQPGAARLVGAREVGVRRRLEDPGGLARLQHPPGEADAGLEDEVRAQLLERADALARVPRADAPQAPVARIDLPDRPELPAERGADRLQRRLVDLDRPFRFREDARY